MKTSRFLLSAAAMAAGLAMSSGVMAQTTSNFQAKIVITKDCAITGASGDLDFGSVASTVTAPQSASATGLKVKCTNLTPYQIGLQSTAASSSTDGTGTMKYVSGSNTYSIGYQLYQTSGATAWGNVNTGTINTQAGVGTGADQSYTVYGKTTATDFNVPAGTYTDTVQVTLYY